VLDGESFGTQGRGIHISNAHDIIIEGLEIRRYDYAIFVVESSRIVIRNNDINMTISRPHAHYGIRLKKCADCLIEGNDAREPLRGHGDYTIYPYSIDRGRGNIFRRNKSVGCCQDILTTRCNSDTDIYENMLRGTTADDGVELEGGTCINLRFWNNLLDNHDGNKVAISTTPVTVGPVYVINNRIRAPYECIKFANDGTANALKAGHRLADFGPLFFFHNTFIINPKHAKGTSIFRGFGFHGNLSLINNIFVGAAIPDVSRNLAAARDSAAYTQLRSNHNFFSDGRTTKSATAGLDVESVFGDPLLEDISAGRWGLKAGSPAMGKAMRLDNVNDRDGADVGWGVTQAPGSP
jgi:parallel beta-helix repeat protein